MLVLFLFLLQGCTERPYVRQDAALIVLKTPSFRYADMGFVYENSDEVKVEIYGSGQALISLRIGKEKVCMSRLECMDKAQFNRRVLSRFYPDDILEHIFRAEALFDGLNLRKNRNGFTQKIIKSDKYHIEYSVLNKQIIFRDTINHIIIKVKRT
jgi:hypothetical protein